MKKIQYKEKVIIAILEYLAIQDVKVELSDSSILVYASKNTEKSLFIKLNNFVKRTKYMVQKDIKTFEITVFNGSV